MKKKTSMKKYFKNYCSYQNSSYLANDSFKPDKNKNNKIKYIIFIELIKLMEDINIK